MKLGLGLRKNFRKIRNEMSFFIENKFRRRNLYDLRTPERVGCIYHVPSDMEIADRLMLFALVRGLRPNRALEIGVRWGNSARIITNAMEENGVGKLVAELGVHPWLGSRASTTLPDAASNSARNSTGISSGLQIISACTR